MSTFPTTNEAHTSTEAYTSTEDAHVFHSHKSYGTAIHPSEEKISEEKIYIEKQKIDKTEEATTTSHTTMEIRK